MKSLLIVSSLVASAAIFGATSSADSGFYKKAAEGGLAEVELGNLAQKKSSDQNVKDFGAMMVKDHSAANDKLKGIAESKGIKLPTSPSVAQMGTKTKLEVLTGNTFDKSYIKSMIEGHEKTLREFKQEAASGQDPDAKAFAAATVPTIETHLSKIKSIAKDAGIDYHDH